eukprot:357464-Chlamydomonas_euryale.AAC.4
MSPCVGFNCDCQPRCDKPTAAPVPNGVAHPPPCHQASSKTGNVGMPRRSANEPDSNSFSSEPQMGSLTVAMQAASSAVPVRHSRAHTRAWAPIRHSFWGVVTAVHASMLSLHRPHTRKTRQRIGLRASMRVYSRVL